jgi:hypothetical protein
MNGMNLEIWFPQQDEVTVFLESSFDDADEELFYETSLFALYAARQIVNFRNDQVAQSLAATLMGIDETNPLEDVEARLEQASHLQASPARFRSTREWCRLLRSNLNRSLALLATSSTGR